MNDQSRQAIQAVANTDAGQIFFRYLMEELCGYQRSSVVLSPQEHEVNIKATIYNEARREIWLHLRDYISIDKLIYIEHKQQLEPVKAQGDLNDRRGDSDAASTKSSSASSSSGYRRRDFQSESAKFADAYLTDLDASATSGSDS
jgi:hypothetical protein